MQNREELIKNRRPEEIESSAEMLGRWANGPLYDGTGNFEYVAKPRALGQEPELAPAGPEPRQVRGCFFA